MYIKGCMDVEKASQRKLAIMQDRIKLRFTPKSYRRLLNFHLYNFMVLKRSLVIISIINFVKNTYFYGAQILNINNMMSPIKAFSEMNLVNQ